MTAEERAEVKRVRSSPVLAELVGQDPASAFPSEASALHALVMLGLRAVRDEELAAGYAVLAASLDAEDEAYERAVRANRRRRRSAVVTDVEGAA